MKLWAPISGDRVLGMAALLIAALGIALGDSFEQRLMAQSGLYAVLALGYRQIFGRLGVLSLAQGAFFGLGAYVLAIGVTEAALPLPLALAAAIGAPALLAACVALPLLRLQSHYLALASLGLAQILLLVALNGQSVSGGANGLGGVALAAYGPAAAPSAALFAALVWLGVLGAAALIGWAGGGLRGLRQQLVRDAPFAAAALGLDAGQLRLVALVLGAGLAGFAGVGHALLNGVVSPDVLELAPMILCLSIAVIGGRNGVGGILATALVLTHLPEFLRFLGSWYLVAYGFAMLAMLIAAPGGLTSLVDRVLPPPTPPMPQPVPAKASAAAPMAMEAAGLRKFFGGVCALDDVGLRVAPGEIVGLIGPNGAGKTTLLNAIGGQIALDGGTICLGERRLERLAVHDRALLGLGRVFQALDLAPDMSALDAVAVAASGTDLRGARAQARHWLERLGISAQPTMAIGHLGVGARRRVEIARALLRQPAILLLDEPTAGLSPADRAGLAGLLGELRMAGRGILIVEHDLAWLGALANRLYCLEAGRVVASGDAGQLRARPELARFFAPLAKGYGS